MIIHPDRKATNVLGYSLIVYRTIYFVWLRNGSTCDRMRTSCKSNFSTQSRRWTHANLHTSNPLQIYRASYLIFILWFSLPLQKKGLVPHKRSLWIKTSGSSNVSAYQKSFLFAQDKINCLSWKHTPEEQTNKIKTVWAFLASNQDG